MYGSGRAQRKDFFILRHAAKRQDGLRSEATLGFTDACRRQINLLDSDRMVPAYTAMDLCSVCETRGEFADEGALRR